MKVLFKILWKDQGRGHLVWASLGTLVGFILLLSGLQFYQNIKGILNNNRDLLDPEYIVINKRVNIGQTLGLGAPGFSQEEIDEIARQPFAVRVAPFISNAFPVKAYTRSSRFPNFITELFFEAVPDEFIDVKSDEWKWKPGQDHIPVILPQDYLNLYNFGFAQSQGLPQIPREMIGMVKFYIRITGKQESAEYSGQIVGFSNRINSILVPYDFLSWANAHFGNNEKTRPSRVILVSNDPTDPEITKFIDSKGYDTIREKLKSSRLNIILKFVLSFLVLIAAIIIGLAFMIFLLGLQLMISRSAEKIRKLHQLGMHYTRISVPYLIILSALLVGVTSLALIANAVLAHKFAAVASQYNLSIHPHTYGWIYWVALGLVALLFSLNLVTILWNTRKICNRG